MLGVCIGVRALSFRVLRTIPSEFFPEAVNGRMTMLVEMPQVTRLEDTAMSVGTHVCTRSATFQGMSAFDDSCLKLPSPEGDRL